MVDGGFVQNPIDNSPSNYLPAMYGYTLPHPFKSSSRGTKLGMPHFFQQMQTRMSRTNPTFVQKKTSRTNDCSFQNKTAVLKSKTPTITELVKEPSPCK
jgi:hypothetical protein